ASRDWATLDHLLVLYWRRPGCTYLDPTTGAIIGSSSSPAPLQPNAFWGAYQPQTGLPSGARASARVTASAGGTVAVICNESNAAAFMSYDGQWDRREMQG